MHDLSDKVALVTGTSNKRGLGRGIALQLAKGGADVVVSDKYRAIEDLDPWDREIGWRGLDSLVNEIEALGRQAVAITADVSNSQEISAMLEKAVEKFGKIDILVNNAALSSRDIGGTVPLHEVSEEVWNWGIAVDLTGVFLMSKAVAKQMIKQGQGGKIINISSIAGKKPLPGRGTINVAKFGAIGLTQIMALELAKYKIFVNAVCPGMIATWGARGLAIYEQIKQGLSEDEAITKAYKGPWLDAVPLGRPGNVEEVASLVAFLASSDSDYITGQAININGGWLMEH